MNDKVILLVDSILCLIMGIICIVYGFINCGQEHMALYFGIGFICGVLGKLIQIKIKDKK